MENFAFFSSSRKQAWLWSLGDAYRIKDRPRYTSTFGLNSSMDTTSPNPLRYSLGDNNNNNINDVRSTRIYFFRSSRLVRFQEENEGEMTQGDRLNEIKARRMQHHHHHTSTAPTWISPTTNVTSSLT